MTKQILVDVDGVLNPLSTLGITAAFQKHRFHVQGGYYTVHLNPAHGKWLTDLAQDTDSQLVWCTFWEADAPRLIAPVLNLPEMPVIPMKRYKMSSSIGEDKGFSALSGVPENTKFAYFDDELDISYFFKENKPRSDNGFHIYVDPDFGLQRSDIEQARNWLLS